MENLVGALSRRAFPLVVVLAALALDLGSNSELVAATSWTLARVIASVLLAVMILGIARRRGVVPACVAAVLWCSSLFAWTGGNYACIATTFGQRFCEADEFSPGPRFPVLMHMTIWAHIGASVALLAVTLLITFQRRRTDP